MSRFHDIAFTKSQKDMTPAERKLVEAEVNKWADELSSKPFGSRQAGYSADVLEMQAIELAKRAKQLRGKKTSNGSSSESEEPSIWSPSRSIWSEND